MNNMIHLSIHVKRDTLLTEIAARDIDGMSPGMKIAIREGSSFSSLNDRCPVVQSSVAELPTGHVLKGVDFAALRPGGAFSHALAERPESRPDTLEIHTRRTGLEARLHDELLTRGRCERFDGFDAAGSPFAVVVFWRDEERTLAGELAVVAACGIGFLLAVGDCACVVLPIRGVEVS